MSAKFDELANPVWHALTGRQSVFAERTADGRACRYQSDVNIFAGVDQLDAAGWSALAELVRPDGVAILSRDEVPEVPRGWTEVYRGTSMQMVAAELADARPVDLVPLDPADVPEMIELAEETVPGPFLPRTIELGRYVGVRQQGRLVAMAGERMRLPGFAEVSAVCTHPSAQREGLAAALTLAVVRGIRERGEEAFLHVVDENEGALRLYRALGFQLHRPVTAVAVRFEG
ncbi:MAG: GNAT family N-acetyltransferase [Deltaproteobacteria bacterium]|nr:GNAT family N-acetyltransferase [Deltaproteobacteria bacterium]